MKGTCIVLAAGFALAAVSFAKAEEPVQIDVAAEFRSSVPILGDVSRTLPEKVNQLSGGSLRLKFHEPGQLFPPGETVDALSKGRAAAAWGCAGAFAAKDSAFALFGSAPFGPDIDEFLAWLYKGGGLEMARDMFHAKGIHNIPCGVTPAAPSGWFTREIRSAADLKGLRMRTFGLAGRVMTKQGVNVVSLPSSEVLAALKDGKLDATVFSLPVIDLPVGFPKYAKYYYFPGWQQPTSLYQLYVNKKVWDGLPERQKATIETACGDTMREMIAAGEAAQWPALKTIQSEGVQLKRWPPEMLVSFEDAWKQIAEEESAKNPNFARIYKSYADFRKNYAIWRHFSFLQ
jgi:TRAP-type mannitol/chloroaromatic compound transport system substrate-binding protein